MRCPRTHGVVFTCVAITPRSPGLNAAVKIRLSRQGLIESITVIGELDLSNVGVLDDAQCALRDHHELPARSLPGCIHGRVGGAYVLRWSKDAQLSAREGLAIMVGGQDTEATRVLSLIA